MSKVIISDTEKKLRMGWSAPPAAPKCPCCKVSVYPAEAVMASDRLNMMLMLVLIMSLNMMRKGIENVLKTTI